MKAGVSDQGNRTYLHLTAFKNPRNISDGAFSISKASGIGSRNLSISSRQNQFIGLTCEAVVYSQYDGYQPAVSQSIIPTITSPRTRIFKLLRSPWVKTGGGQALSCNATSLLNSGKAFGSASIPPSSVDGSRAHSRRVYGTSTSQAADSPI